MMAHPKTRIRRHTQLCIIFVCVIIFFVGLIFLILWLSLRPHSPKFHIQDFFISDLGQPTGLQNPRMIFNVTVRNGNPRIGIFYESLKGSAYYKDRWIGSTQLLDPFYQEPKKTTIVYHVLTGTPLIVNGQRPMGFNDDLAKGLVDFRLELTSVVRYRTKLWDTKRHQILRKCFVSVGPDGLLLPSYKDEKCTS